MPHNARKDWSVTCEDCRETRNLTPTADSDDTGYRIAVGQPGNPPHQSTKILCEKCVPKYMVSDITRQLEGVTHTGITFYLAFDFPGHRFVARPVESLRTAN